MKNRIRDTKETLFSKSAILSIIISGNLISTLTEMFEEFNAG